ncbi:MAG: hypothetical protein SOY73_10075 [Blautia sp.]|nr:hypothetical protein [Blautia sp.]MDY3999419.1 hypothetical protein [Blautia sp.]
MLQIFKRYLCIWLLIILGLCIISLAVHWSDVVSACCNTFGAYLNLVGVCAVLVGGIISLIFSVF